MMRRLPSLAIAVASLCAGCLTTTHEKVSRTVTVRTAPQAAEITRVESGVELFAGESPARIDYRYEIVRQKFDPRCYWLTASALPAFALGGGIAYAVAGSGSSSGVIAQWVAGGVLAAAAAGGSLHFCGTQAAKASEETIAPPLPVFAWVGDRRYGAEISLSTPEELVIHVPLRGAAAQPPALDVPPAGPAALADAVSFRGRAQPNAYALAVGIGRYRDLPSPGASRRDAERFARIATEALGVPPDNVRVVLDERASKADLHKQLLWLQKNVPPGGKVYFYFSGHGAPDVESGSAYLMPFDGDADFVVSSGMLLEDVYRELDRSRASEVLVFLDSCFSGSGGRSVLPPGTRPLVTVKEASPGSRKLAVLSAAKGSQISGSTAEGDGLFTRTLLEGLATGASDLDGDGRITLLELSSWVSPRVRREALKSNREQTPQVRSAASPDEFLVTGR